MNRALVKVIAGESSLDSKTLRQVVNLGITTSVVAGLTVGVIAFFIGSNFLPVEGQSQWVIASVFGGIVMVRGLHFVLAETTRGFHEANWANFFGGPAGGPFPHTVFLVALIAAWLMTGSVSLTTVLVIYLCCFTVTLPPLFFKLRSLTETVANEMQLSGADRSTKEGFAVGSIWILAIPLMLTQTFGLTLSQADIWLAGAMVLPASIAIYCAAQRMLSFLTVPLQISGTAIVSFIPELLAKNKKKQLQEMVGLATFASGIPGLMIGAVLLAFPSTILSFIFGEYFAQAAPILQILVAGQMISVLTGPCEIMLMMAGHQNKTLVVNVVAAIAIFVLGPVGIISGGILGLAIAMSTVTASQNIFNWWMTKKLVGIGTHFDIKYASQLLAQVRQRVLSQNGPFNVTS